MDREIGLSGLWEIGLNDCMFYLKANVLYVTVKKANLTEILHGNSSSYLPFDRESFSIMKLKVFIYNA